MPWYAWVAIAFIAIDRLGTVASVGEEVEVTPGFAVASLIAGGLMIWVVLALAGVA